MLSMIRRCLFCIALAAGLCAPPLVWASFLPTAVDGNIGIGSTAPTQKLDVAGTVKATAFSGNGAALTNLPASSPAGAATQVQFNNAGTLSGASGLVYENASGNVGIGSAQPIGPLDVISALIVLANGNVGIGSLVPSAKLDVRGDVNLNNNFSISDSGNEVTINLAE